MVRRVVSWFVPLALREHDEVWRARFLVQTLLIGTVITTLMLGIYLALGQRALLVQTIGITAALLTVLGLIKLGVPIAPVTHFGLLVVTAAFTAAPLADGHFDGAAVAWFCVVPFVAVLVLDLRAAVAWSALVLVIIVLLYLQPDLPVDDAPQHRVATLGRALALVVTVLVFATSFRAAQHEARERVERANAAKSRFLANMSHELRTPMNGVLGMVDVILQKPLDAELTAQLELIRHSGKAMVELVNGILDLSRIEAGKLTVELQPFSLEQLAEDLEHLFRPLAAQRSLGFHVERTALGPVSGDALRLRQVLTNLLDNALKFTPSGEVRLSVKGIGEDVRFEVSDTGPGIAPIVAARLFSPFEQADSSTTRRFGGSGLGLALSKQLVELMGGQLTLDSEVGRGSTFGFTLRLPAAVVAPEPAAADAPRARGRVLVVDDNPINLKVACALVKSAGYEVGDATNGRLALERLAAEPWDVVLMDCHMPEMDGLEATRRLRAQGSTVPIIALTAAAMPNELEACHAAGMNECLTKPVNFGALKRALAAAVRR